MLQYGFGDMLGGMVENTEWVTARTGVDPQTLISHDEIRGKSDYGKTVIKTLLEAMNAINRRYTLGNRPLFSSYPTIGGAAQGVWRDIFSMGRKGPSAYSEKILYDLQQANPGQKVISWWADAIRDAGSLQYMASNAETWINRFRTIDASIPALPSAPASAIDQRAAFLRSKIGAIAEQNRLAPPVTAAVPSSSRNEQALLPPSPPEEQPGSTSVGPPALTNPPQTAPKRAGLPILLGAAAVAALTFFS